MAPQWLLPRTAATATFVVRARSIARRIANVSPSKAASSADIPHAAKMPVTTACSRSGGIRRSRSAPGYALTRRSKRDDAASLHAHAEEDDRPGGAGIPETFRLGELELLLRHAGPGRAEVQER